MTLIKAHICVNYIAVIKSNTYKDTQGITQADIHVRLYKTYQHIYQGCGRNALGMITVNVNGDI